jgi:uncharacterized RDD family membrane protein YckC
VPRTLARDSASVLDEVEMITGDAVTLAVPPAPLALRVVGAIIDVIVLVVLQIGLYVGLSRFLDGLSTALIETAIVAIMIVVLVAWPAGFETVSGGRSPGKFVCGTRVVRDDGGPILFRHAFARALLGTVELYGFSPAVAFLSAVVSRRHQRLGDRLAGTYVVRARSSWTASDPVAMPAHLAGWARTADLEQVPTVEVSTCRRFLARRDRISPEARERTARSLIFRVAPWILPAPPPATDEDLLAAILAERFRRERERLHADAALTARLFGDRRPAQPYGGAPRS